jgi:DNA-binding response OmpR family regulator
VRSRQTGFDDHLVKPVDVAALIAVIDPTDAPKNSSEGSSDADGK